ncbi:MAG: MBL fold metallo-hydrolase [Alphaproteobacteria bacterium]|nr:MAG: MBL fold metallo-hydrolase [Alphaproteobacteria bacterium]
MKFSRRHFLTAAGAAALSAGLPARVWSLATLESGAVRIDSLSDGHLTLPGSFIFGPAPQAELEALLKAHGMPGIPDTITPPCNVTLLRDGARTVLFDTGSGSGFQNTAGELPDALDEVGVAPEDVTHVVFTHGHPDHLWGVIDDLDEPTFYEAEHLMNRTEFDYWSDPETVNRIGEARASFAAGALRRLQTMGADAFTLFEGETEVLPGVLAIPTHGHSPGHTSFAIATDGGQILVTGDAITNSHMAFERPEWHSGSDQDLEAGAATRVRLLDRIVAEDMTLIGYHIEHPGIGRAERTGKNRYRFVPLGG